MNTHTCDLCGKSIDKDNPAPHGGSQEGHFVIGEKVLPFSFTLRVTAWNFPAQNFDVCQRCLIEAINHPAPVPAKKEDVEAVKQAETNGFHSKTKQSNQP